MISLDHDDEIMAAAGHQAETILEGIRTEYTGNHIVAVEGNPPLNADGMYCVVDGRPFADPLMEWCADAAAVIASGPRESRGCAA